MYQGSLIKSYGGSAWAHPRKGIMEKVERRLGMDMGSTIRYPEVRPPENVARQGHKSCVSRLRFVGMDDPKLQQAGNQSGTRQPLRGLKMYTKGPWIISKPQHCAPDQKNDRLIHDKEMRHIAEVFQYQNQQNINGPSEANAHLIAASPDMLEVLEEIIDGLDSFNQSDEVPFGFAMPILKAKEVIKKAKGNP